MAHFKRQQQRHLSDDEAGGQLFAGLSEKEIRIVDVSGCRKTETGSSPPHPANGTAQCHGHDPILLVSDHRAWSAAAALPPSCTRKGSSLSKRPLKKFRVRFDDEFLR